MSYKELKITFSQHVPQDKIASMVSGIAAYGNGTADSSDRIFIIEVFRLSKLPKLQKELHALEKYSFLRWQAFD